MSVDILSGRLFASEGGKKDEAQMPKRTRSAKLQLDAPSKLSKVISLRPAQFKHRVRCRPSTSIYLEQLSSSNKLAHSIS